MKYEYKTVFVPWRGAGGTLQNMDELDTRMTSLGADRWRLCRIQEVTIGILVVFERESAA